MKRVLGYILTALVFSSCMKERSSDVFVPYPTLDTAWAAAVTGRVENAADLLFTPPPAEAISVSTNTYDTAKFGNISVCTAPGFCTQPNGSPVQGNVKIELLQFIKKGDFIRYGKPTLNGNKLLDKQTIFRLKVTQYFEPMILNDKSAISIRCRTSLMNGHVSVFSGDTSFTDATSFTWEETPDAARPYDAVENNQLVFGYDIPCRKLGWISFGKQIDNMSGNKLTVIQPVMCTNTNTAVYAVFKNQRTVLRLTPDLNNRTFVANAIPAGAELLLVSISQIGTKLYLGSSYFVMPASTAVTKVKPEVATKAQISDFLDGL